MITDMPYKVSNAILFNIPLYFLPNLRREAGSFFFFVLISFTVTLVMSMMLRTVASLSRTVEQAEAPAALLIIAILIYTGFVLPTNAMLGWSRWINFIDPIAYGFEALMANEFHNRNFTCSQYIPTGPNYADVTGDSRSCYATGAVAGQDYVSGDAYLAVAFNYTNAHKWRNWGIMIAFLLAFLFVYLWAAENVSAKKSKGEVLLFQRRNLKRIKKLQQKDEEQGNTESPTKEEGSSPKEQDVQLQQQTAIFHWSDLTYDIKTEGGDRRLLDMVDGWVKRGTLTALIGESGAGKTTLLDVLATRKTVGVIGGKLAVDGRRRDASFQRKTGYVQQQDIHLETATVREALNFSAVLRQPSGTSRADKLAYVDEVIKLLDMHSYVDAVIGAPGTGLNVEQRKRLSIGIELAAKPELLLFLDEPTSGLDSQTSWAICDLLKHLAKNGQAILCTIHQPSAMLFQQFDRLLFLTKGGKPVYFGEIGRDSRVLINYFEQNGAAPCDKARNPAEWILEVVGAAPGSKTDIDWPKTWRDSDEFQTMKSELRSLEKRKKKTQQSTSRGDKAAYQEFAQPFGFQFQEVTHRVAQQFWRDPVYIYSRVLLCFIPALFIGFTLFKSPSSQGGIQNQLFAIFMRRLTIFHFSEAALTS